VNARRFVNRSPLSVHQLHELGGEVIIERLGTRIFASLCFAQRQERAILVQERTHAVLRRTARLRTFQRNRGRLWFIVFKGGLATSSVGQERAILVQERTHAVLRRAPRARATLQGAERPAHNMTQLTQLQCARE
jgi:hypothetical protein